MCDSAKLMQIISESGMKQAFIAGKLGISSETLAKKVKGLSDFKTGEVEAMAKLFRLSKADISAIFFPSV